MPPMLHHHQRSAPVASKLYTIAAGSLAVLLIICIVSYPDAAFRASLQGLKVWWNIIFPALLPFLVLSELLLAYGWVHGLGVLLNPVMRLLFRLPGVSGWAWAVGWTAGYPAGAEAVVKLRQQRRLSRSEGNRLLGLTHASSPVFMIAVIGVGFMQQADTGLLIAIVHWLSALLTAFILRWTAQPNEADAMHADTVSGSRSANDTEQPGKPTSLPRSIVDAMELAHRADGRPLGKLLGDSVSSAVQTLMMIGGYMMIFSVIIQVSRLVIPHQFGAYVLNGLLEVNLGAFTIGTATFASPVFQAALVSAVLGWSGISAHLQVHSLMKNSDLRFSHFLLSRMVHAISAFLLTYVCWEPFRHWFSGNQISQPALLQPIEQAIQPASVWHSILNWILTLPTGWLQIMPLLIAAIFMLSVLCISSALIAIWTHIVRSR
ncbi:nucleoside recognition domain-containing protein [Paenibacillus marinisediminis]